MAGDLWYASASWAGTETIGRSALRCLYCVVDGSVGLVQLGNHQARRNDGAELDIMDKVRSLDLLPRQPQPVDAVARRHPARAAAAAR